MSLLKRIDLLKNKKILVIGDVMIDSYEYGKVSRISQEAPVQVVKFNSSRNVLGGAANTANNLACFGAEVYLLGIAGDDENSKILFQCLEKSKISSEGIIIDKTRPTIVKKRIVSGKNQLIRIDYEETAPINLEIQSKIQEFLRNKINSVDAVVISDYDKGLLTPELMKYVVRVANDNNKPTVLDGKSKNLDSFKNVTLVTPNLVEAKEMSGINDDVEKMGKILVEKLNANIFLTRGSDGISVFEKNGAIIHVPTKKVSVYDVTGAGDTVVAVASLGLAAGMTFQEIAEIANVAGRIVVQKSGTATVTLDEIKQTLDSISVRESYEEHEKIWGKEEWIVNLDGVGYCGKKLVLNKGYQCSIHHHKEKDEVFYINKGFVLMIIDGKEHFMKPESRVRIEPGTKHRFIGITNSEIIEISSHHKEDDSYREENELSGKVDEEKFKKYLETYSKEMENEP